MGTAIGSSLVKKMYALFRRKYRTLLLLVVVAVLFYLLQCFTVSKLGNLSRSNTKLNMPINGGQDEVHHIDVQENRHKLEHFKQEDIDNHWDQTVPSFLRHKIDHDKLANNENGENNEARKNNQIENRKVNIQIHQDKVKHEVNRGNLFAKENGESPCQDSKSLRQFGFINMTKDSRLIAASVNLFGVLQSDKHLYKADEKNMLSCLTATQVRIYIIPQKCLVMFKGISLYRICKSAFSFLLCPEKNVNCNVSNDNEAMISIPFGGHNLTHFGARLAFLL